MDEIDHTFAKRVRRLPEERGLAQDALGRCAGLSGKYVGQVERLERGTTLRNGHELARALGVGSPALAAEISLVREPETEYPNHPAALQRVVALLRGLGEEDLAVVERLLVAWKSDGPKSRMRVSKRRR